MNTLKNVGAASVLALAVASCGNSADSALKDYIDGYSDYGMLPAHDYSHANCGYATFDGEYIPVTDSYNKKCLPFFEGLAYVAGAGFIDKELNTVIDLPDSEFGYDNTLCCFSEGVAFVTDAGGRTITAINRKGEELFVVEGYPQSRVLGGYFIYTSRRYDKHGGIMNAKGEIVFEADDDAYISINNSRSAAHPTQFPVYGKDGFLYILDIETGEHFLEGTEVEWYNNNAWPVLDWNGMIVVYDSDTRLYGLMDGKGEWCIYPKYEELRNDGAWYMFVEDGMAGWCDKGGEVKIPAQFEYGSFSSRYFAFNGSDYAYIDTEKAYIDRSGKVVATDAHEPFPQTYIVNGRYLQYNPSYREDFTMWVTLPSLDKSSAFNLSEYKSFPPFTLYFY